ncbi:DedA family protein [Clostridium thermobutyricum]|uniref:DedA family protein n=1 Tax=Clostridium thermobutyricum TaxID=29372 RepID=UPI0018AB0029|nr:DedA family protein [Clostridium thermobutyricum]
MFDEVLRGLIYFFGNFGVLGIFIIVTLEYSAFPISSELLLPFIGIMMYSRFFTYWEVIFFSILGGLLGSTIGYCIGHYGRGKILALSNKKYIGVKGIILEIDKWFYKYGKIAVVICRVLPMTRNFISIWAGLQKMKFSIYISYSFLGITIWNTTLILIGYFLGEDINSIESALIKCTVLAYFSLIITILYFYIIRKIKLKGKMS